MNEVTVPFFQEILYTPSDLYKVDNKLEHTEEEYGVYILQYFSIINGWIQLVFVQQQFDTIRQTILDIFPFSSTPLILSLFGGLVLEYISNDDVDIEGENII